MSELSPHPERLTDLAAYRSLYRSAGLVWLVFVVGIVGYLVIGGTEYDLLDAIYMTVITLTTVGYGEVIDLTNSPGGKVFTIFLLFGGVGAFVNFFSSLTAFVVEGEVHDIFRRRKMTKAIDALSDHYIVCGGGHTGQYVLKELQATGRPFVLIDLDTERVRKDVELLEEDFPLVLGDATDDHVLQRAGIDRARGVVACLSSDKDNLIVTVSARLLNPAIRIVCRSINEGLEAKILQAGADATVSPNKIGGLRLISEMVRPTAVNYLDRMLHGTDDPLRIESVPVCAGSKLDGLTVAELRELRIEGLLLLAANDEPGPGDDWVHAPPDDLQIVADMRLVFMGTADVRRKMEELGSVS